MLIADVKTTTTTIWKPDYLFSTPNVTSVDVSCDNDTIAAGMENGDIRLYSIRKVKEIGSLSQGGWRVITSFSPDGKMLVSTAHNNKVKLWEVGSQRRIKTWDIDGRVEKIKWLSGKPWIAFGTDRGELIIESTENRETIFKGKVVENGIVDIDYFASEQLLLLCDSGGNIALFKIQSP